MNMMTLQERREEQAVPDFVRDLSQEFDFADDAAGAAVSDAPVKTSALERLAWFRDLSLAKKINAIFGTFFAVGALMTLVLGLGLGELWDRYNSTARVQEALVSAGEIESAAGELRYHPVRTLYDRSANLRENRRASEAAIMSHIATLDTAMREHVPDMEPRVSALKARLDAFRSEADAAGEAVQAGGSANAGAAALAVEGTRLLEEAGKLAADLAARAKAQEASGISYFFNMVLILAVLAAFGATVLLLGMAYLSRDFSRKIVEITGAMTRLAAGNRDFTIEGQSRKDEIGAMVRALELFKRAGRQMEIWARERSEKAEQELQLQQERERERVDAEARKAALLDEVAIIDTRVSLCDFFGSEFTCLHFFLIGGMI